MIPETPPTPPPQAPTRRAGLAALFLVATAGVWVFQAPHDRIGRHLYNDAGANLTGPALVARGLRPTVDFGYIYGLLPLELNRLAAAFGTTPAAIRPLSWALAAGLALGLARFATRARVGPVGVGLLLVALPDLLQGFGIATVQAIEPVLIVHALASQAAGHRGLALALATADLFAKPAMAYVYGLILLVAGRLADPAGWRRAMVPAAAVGLLLAAWLGLRYGPVPLARTFSPGAGMEVYRQNHYGFFFGDGRAFWRIPGGGLRDYLRYEVGAWLVGTAVLAAGGLGSLLRLRRGRGDAADEVVATCAVMHVTFVTLFYGQRLSWVYYYAVLVAGLAAMTGPGRPRRRSVAVGLVLVLTLAGSKVKVQETARLWRTARVVDDPGLAGLWATPGEMAEWRGVRALAEERGPAAWLARTEGAALVAPGVFEAPETLYFVPGHPTPAEIARKARQIGRANTVVIVRPRGDAGRGGYDRWPEIAEALRPFRTVWAGDDYEVVRRAP